MRVSGSTKACTTKSVCSRKKASERDRLVDLMRAAVKETKIKRKSPGLLGKDRIVDDIVEEMVGHLLASDEGGGYSDESYSDSD